MYQLFFTDSIGQKHQLNFQPHSYPNLMEFIRDQGYEDWGDCRGRAWCATCHIKISSEQKLEPKDIEEQKRLNQLTNLQINSRLACQIPLNKNIHNIKIIFCGDD